MDNREFLEETKFGLESFIEKNKKRREIYDIDSSPKKFKIIDRLDEDACMEFYMDNSALEEYIERGKETACLSKKEICFWENAIETGKVNDVLRTAIMELHPEDRKNDPVDIKIARKTLKYMEANEENRQRDDKHTKDGFSALYYAGYLVKEVIKGKIQNPNRNVKDIVQQAEKSEEDILKKADEKVQVVIDFLNGTKRDSNGVDIAAYKRFYKRTKISEFIDRYDKVKINEYVEKYKENKNESLSYLKTSEEKENLDGEQKQENEQQKIYGSILGRQTTKQQENLPLRNKIQNIIQSKLSIKKTKLDDNQIKFGE